MIRRLGTWVGGLAIALALGGLPLPAADEDNPFGPPGGNPPPAASAASDRESRIFADLDAKPKSLIKEKPGDALPMGDIGPAERLYQMLMSLDGNNDKMLSRGEFQRLPGVMPPPLNLVVLPRVRDIFKQLDADNNEAISADEARIGSEQVVRELGLDKLGGRPAGPGPNDAEAAQKAQAAITFYDKTNDAQISKREAMVDPEFAAVFDDIDRDRDEKVGFNELFRYFSQGQRGDGRRWFGRGFGKKPGND